MQAKGQWGVTPSLLGFVIFSGVGGGGGGGGGGGNGSSALST